MMEFGKTLRAAREAKGYTVSQLAEVTHLLPQIVEGLENEDFSRIVAPIYGRGFVKLYCEAVGLEAKPMVDAFMAAFTGKPAEPMPDPVMEESPQDQSGTLSRYATPLRDRLSTFSLLRIPWRLCVVIGAAVLVLWLLVAAICALYHATMTASETPETPTPAATETPVKPIAADAPREPVKINALYVD